MAPSASKMKKPVVKTIFQRPADSILKRPAAKPQPETEVSDHSGVEEESEEEEPARDCNVAGKLTKKAVKDHNLFCEQVKGMSPKEFEKALDKLDPAATQRLWKQFQASRKVEGEEKTYQEAVQGNDGGQAGSLAKKRKLLRCWIMSDKTCGDRYREYVQEVTLSKEKGVKEKWLTLVQALNHWGKEELWARVQAGTILARKNPLDTRYWEFRALQQVGLTKTSHTHKSSTGVSGKVDKACQESFFNQDWGDVVEDDWKLGAVDDEGDPSEEGVHKGLAEALGIKVPKPKEKPKKEDVWETTSKITAADSHQDILDKVWKFKAELEKDISQLDSKEYEAKKAGLDDKELLKKKKAVMPKLQDALTSLTTLLKKPKFKTEEVSDSMGKALQALQAAKPIKASLQKALKKPD
ncbi:Uncharacterized protein SCF082_LOCUS12675 [Durusdinium trenchii]|uniref:Uncharacterized protein n=2 Tax=Durusdinium trenchii TaxID=1381693 RepID=A0ABP0JLE2_9DINO